MPSEEAAIWSRLDERWAHGAVARLTSEELGELLAAAPEHREIDAGLGGVIRVLRRGTQFVIQEQTGKGEIVVRLLPTNEAAEAFVAERLEAYERLWDGCGCKINYFEP